MIYILFQYVLDIFTTVWYIFLWELFNIYFSGIAHMKVFSVLAEL